MDEFASFLKRHDISIVNTEKKFSRHTPTYNYFSTPLDYNSIHCVSQIETEPLYTIQIPESELKRLQKFEDQVFNNMAQNGHFNLFQVLMEQKENEKRLQAMFPAVKLAYENYSLVLNICKGENNGNK